MSKPSGWLPLSCVAHLHRGCITVDVGPVHTTSGQEEWPHHTVTLASTHNPGQQVQLLLTTDQLQELASKIESVLLDSDQTAEETLTPASNGRCYDVRRLTVKELAVALHRSMLRETATRLSQTNPMAADLARKMAEEECGE